jgi:hypothetical protein
MPNLTFTAQGDTIWQGTEFVATSQYADHLVELLNAGLAAKKGEKV